MLTIYVISVVNVNNCKYLQVMYNVCEALPCSVIFYSLLIILMTVLG